MYTIIDKLQLLLSAELNIEPGLLFNYFKTLHIGKQRLYFHKTVKYGKKGTGDLDKPYARQTAALPKSFNGTVLR